MLKRVPDHLNHRISLFLSTKSCSSLESLLSFHALILTSGLSDNPFIASKLISHYASLRAPSSSSAGIFNSVRRKDVFLWNSVIKAHFSNGDHQQALQFFHQMRVSGLTPNNFTLPMAIVASADLLWLRYGETIYGLASKLGLCQGESAVGSSLVHLYCKCGETGDARKVFDEITVRDIVAWTTLVIGYVQNGESGKGLLCLFQMCRDGERPNSRTLQGGFQGCANLSALTEGRSLHCSAVKTGTGSFYEVKSSILSMYSQCDVPVEAYKSFLETPKNDVMLWMSVISVHSRSGLMRECASLYREMHVLGVCPDEIITSCVLWGFGESMAVVEGKAFHGFMIRRHDCDFLSVDKVDNALASMYCKFGLSSVAERIFRSKLQWSEEACSTMISGYSKIGDSAKCIELFKETRNRGIEARSAAVLASVVSSCSRLGATNLGRSLHCYSIKNSMINENTSLTNSVMDMYGKNGDLLKATRLFGLLGMYRDTVTWNTMIACYVQGERFEEALALFDEIGPSQSPNQASFTIALSACSHMASLEKGKKIHRLLEESGVEINSSLTSALIDMYAKCGDLERSRNLFDSADEKKDVVTWNAMISGYAKHGHVGPAIELFHEMEIFSGVTPNGVTFLALLSACAHSGLVDEGKHLFSTMQNRYFLKPELKHYTCMVDLFGRSGLLREAEDSILTMPVIPDGGIWGSLLSACVKHEDHETGVRVALRAIEWDPQNDGYHTTLSNMYRWSGRWEEAEKVRRMMRERGVDKEPGWSSTEMQVS